ncbi:MAG: hypothetical protein IIA33_05010 [Planctomycetes bacterium]|nr:hypothetical protein [Planctomycetota bacterium]
MNKLWKLVILCTGCLSLMAADSALADYVGLVHVTKADEDTVNLCNNANGDNVPEPLDVCNILAQFTNPVDRLLSVGNADITASNGLYYQHPASDAANSPRAPGCNQITDPPPFGFPDLICDSFITIGVKCGPEDPADGTAPDGDFDLLQFTNDGIVVGGWFNGTPTNGQGDAGTWPCLQVLFLQLSVPTGESITGTISVFATINDEIVAFANQVVDCSGAQDCPQGEACYDCDPCTVDDTCDADGNCVGTPVECKEPGDECNTASCDPNGADGNCDILTPEPDGTACG